MNNLLNRWGSRAYAYLVLPVVRLAPDLLLTGVIMYLYVAEVHINFAPALQLLVLKGLLVSIGFMHAHIAGKIMFPKCDWTISVSGLHVLRVVIYAVFVYSYAVGG